MKSLDLVSDLHTRFGFTSFRPGQKEAIQHLLESQHTLVVMPTGSGKSLVFQLAALHLPGLTLVISPLIALMKDQVDSLDHHGIPATLINSTLSGSEQNRRLNNLAVGHYRIVYVAPERLRSAQFLSALRAHKVSLLAVDEAHCISEWGHDFRPDYLYIAQFRAMLGHPLTAALTATATPRVQEDILLHLGLMHAQRIVTGFNRPNLAFEVHTTAKRSARVKTLQKLLGNPHENATIIYTGTRREAEEVADFVKAVMRIKCRHYHAGLPAEERTYIQDLFMSGDLSVVVATNAFGMGIDRSDVRQVIHYSLPGSIEAYYQEAGRAGRDGLPARAVLLYSPEDRALQEWFIANNTLNAADLRVLYDTIKSAIDWQKSITLEEFASLTGLSEVKVRIGLAEMERAALLERQDDQGLRMHLRLHDWKPPVVKAIADKLKLHQEHRQAQLERMIAYAESNACRRSILLNYFGDPGPAEAEDCCDNCRARQATQPATRLDISPLSQSARTALIILDSVHRLRHSIGREKIAQVLKGSKAKEIVQPGYDQNVYYGRLAVFSLDEIKEMTDELLEMGYLKVIGGRYPVLRLTPQGEAALRDKAAIRLKLPRQAGRQKNERRKTLRLAGRPGIPAKQKTESH